MRPAKVLRSSICLLILAAAPLAAESTISCPSGKIDVLDWLTLDANLRSSKHMEGSGGYIYTVVNSDKYYWMKTPQGDTWDINLYDANRIYLWITESGYGTPRNFKKAHLNTNVPFMDRCATPGFPGNPITVANNTYDNVINCSTQSGLIDVGKSVMELWGPYTAGHPGLEATRTRIGGDVPDNTTVYVVSYRWSCDNNYSNCATKEEFTLAQAYGLVRWNAWKWTGLSYIPDGESTFNLLRTGVVNPNFPCF